MLTFFRRIRKGLLGTGTSSKPASPARPNGLLSGQAGRYLIYAVGEILLVMIGILLALQVNNWNDERKDRKAEVLVLENLVKSLNLNVNQFDHKLDRIRRDNLSGDIIFSVVKNKNNNSDTLRNHWHRALINHGNLILSNAGYESLRNVGFDIIKSESLKEEIINLYENSYLTLSRQQIWGNTIRPDWDDFIMKHFIRAELGLIPRDFDFIINSNYFYGLIDAARVQRRFYRRYYRESLEETNSVLQLINEELGKS